MPPIAAIRDILDRGVFSELVGAREDEWFEAKESHEFNFGSPAHRFELAKDVSSFANQEGGYLVIGLRTQPVPEQQTDMVSEVTLLARGEFERDRVSGILAEYIYPEIEGLVVDWVPSSEVQDRGLGCIFVPAQPADKKPFLMKRVIDDGTELRQIVFGIAFREQAGNEPYSVDRLHRALQHGKSLLSERLTRMEAHLEAIRGVVTAPIPAAVPADLADARVEGILADD